MAGLPSKPLQRAAAGVAVLSLGAAGAVLAMPSHSAPRPAAGGGKPAAVLTRYVAPGARGRCTRTSPCGSLATALKGARPGSVIQVAGGRYPEQVLKADGRRAGAAAVTIRPARGARARFAGLRCGAWSGDVGPGALRITGVRFDNVLVHRCDRLTLRDVEVHGGLYLEGSTRFSMIGGSVGPGTDFHPDVKAVYQSKPPIVPRKILFDGVRFHDWTLRTPGEHIECLQISDVDGLTIRRSRFERCDTFDLHVEGTEAGPVRDVRIEDNDFGTTSDHSGSTRAYYSLSVRDGIGVTILRNRSRQGWALPAKDATVEGWTVAHNSAPMGSWQCDARITYRLNRWIGARCGATDRRPARRR
jgi:hypothetical protein